MLRVYRLLVRKGKVRRDLRCAGASSAFLGDAVLSQLQSAAARDLFLGEGWFWDPCALSRQDCCPEVLRNDGSADRKSRGCTFNEADDLSDRWESQHTRERGYAVFISLYFFALLYRYASFISRLVMPASLPPLCVLMTLGYAVMSYCTYVVHVECMVFILFLVYCFLAVV